MTKTRHLLLAGNLLDPDDIDRIAQMPDLDASCRADLREEARRGEDVDFAANLWTFAEGLLDH